MKKWDIPQDPIDKVMTKVMWHDGCMTAMFAFLYSIGKTRREINTFTISEVCYDLAIERRKGASL